MALILVDKENYILDGVIYEIPLLDVPLDESSAEKAVMFYKSRMVDTGLAFGKLDVPIKESIDNDMPMDEFVSYSLQDPIAAAQAMSTGGYVDDEEVVNQSEAAFQILDIAYDREGGNILGRIYLLDSPAGLSARSKVDEGMRCVISQALVDEVVDNKDRERGGFRLNQIIRKIRGGWRLSFEQEENVKSNSTNGQ